MQALFEGVLKDRRLWQREILAGITAFFAISYIIVVNPIILADAGMPAELSVFATIFSSIIGCLIMAFVADAPIVLTPGMGINAFFTYTVCVQMGLSWQEPSPSRSYPADFRYVACTKWRDRIAHAVPNSLKCAITAGIGLFLVEIGLEKAQLIRSGANSIIELGSLTNPMALLALFGLVLSLALYLRGVTGSFFIAILVTTAVAQVFGIKDPTPLDLDFAHIYDYPQLLLQADFHNALSIPFLLSVFSMSMIMIFETMGLLEGILPDRSKFSRTFRGSAVTTIISSLLGTSPTVAAAERRSRHREWWPHGSHGPHGGGSLRGIAVLHSAALVRAAGGYFPRHHHHGCDDDAAAPAHGLSGFLRVVPRLSRRRADPAFRQYLDRPGLRLHGLSALKAHERPLA